MDYFAYSPFWNTRCNNNVLRTQRRVENPSYGHAQEKSELIAFRSGFEYVVAHAQPPALFVIHRRSVLANGTREDPSSIYFILDGKVYPTPTLYDVIATRLNNAAHLVSDTFSTLMARHPPANPRAHPAWRSLPPNAEKESSKEPALEGEKEKKAGGPDWQLFHALSSSRAALPELDKMARSSPSLVDPLAELRAVEETLVGQSTKGAPSIRMSSVSGTPRPTGTPGLGRTPSMVASSPWNLGQ